MTRPSVPEERHVLSRDLSVFLVQFSIALHKNAAYPQGHPLLLSAVEAVTLRLTSMLNDRPVLSLGVTKNQLVIEGGATDPSNPVLRELAQRLYRHQLGAIKFSQGVGPDEVADLLKTIGADSGRDAQPLGLRPAEELQRWPHVRLFPMAFDQLELAGEDSRPPEELPETRSAILWQSLAAAALQAQDLGPHAPSLEPADVAKAINEQKRDVSYDRVIVNYLLQLSRELRLSQGGEASVLQKRLTGLMGGLKPEVLKQLLELGGEMAQRRQLVNDASHTMPVNAVLEVARAASAASQQTISHSLLRLLSKLASHAEEGASPIRADADAALRDTVRQLVDGWTLDDPNPESYTHLLERLSRPASAPTAPEGAAESEAHRIVKISLEIGAYGESVWRAADEMVSLGQVTTLLDMLDQTKDRELIVEAYWQHLATPECVRRLLLMNEGRDFDAVERILSRMGLTAAEPMLDALEVTDSRTTRRRLLTRLGQLGMEIGPMIMARLPSSPWFVQRNLLALLGTLPTWPPGFSPISYAENADSRVRREAIKLMLRLPSLKDGAVVSGLGDSDPQIVRLALGAALEGCPVAAGPRLMLVLNNKDTAPEDRVLSVRVLATLHTSAARDWLLARTLAKQRWFRGPRLQHKSPEMLAALSGLATYWRQEPKASTPLRLAVASNDPEIRAAAGGTAAS